jgi:hypothetical protein
MDQRKKVVFLSTNFNQTLFLEIQIKFLMHMFVQNSYDPIQLPIFIVIIETLSDSNFR